MQFCKRCNNHLTTTCKYAATDIINISFMNANSLHSGPNQILIPKAFSDMKFDIDLILKIISAISFYLFTQIYKGVTPALKHLL